MQAGRSTAERSHASETASGIPTADEVRAFQRAGEARHMRGTD